MTITLERRNRRASQSAARSKRDDAMLAQEIRKEREAKEREALGWLKMIGWFELTDGQRHGSFLALEAGMADERTVARWDETSRKAVAAAEVAAATPREALNIRFANPVTIDVRRELRAHGLSWSKTYEHWEGTLTMETAQMLADKYGGQVRRFAGGTLMSLSEAPVAAE